MKSVRDSVLVVVLVVELCFFIKRNVSREEEEDGSSEVGVGVMGGRVTRRGM